MGPDLRRERALGGSREENGCTIVPMEFAPRQSWFVVFRKGVRGQGSGVRGGDWPAFTPVEEITGAWEVSFDPKWGGPAQARFEKLEDWTKRPEPGIRYYSGKAIYRKTFDAPNGTFPPLGFKRLFLDLGSVKNLAAVRLNGRDLGAVWCAPWRVEISDTIKPSDNQLEITVVNLWPNRMIGDQSLPREKRFTWTTWNPFTKDSALMESGLLGPVTLQATDKGRAQSP